MKHRVVRLISKLPLVRPDIVSGKVKIDSLNVTYRDGLLHVHLDGFVPRERTALVQERVELFQEYLERDIGEPVHVDFSIIAVDMIEVSGKPPERHPIGQQGDAKSE